MDINQYQSIYIKQLAEGRGTLKETEAALKSAIAVRDGYAQMPGDRTSLLALLDDAISQLKDSVRDCQNEILIIEEKIVSLGSK